MAELPKVMIDRYRRAVEQSIISPAEADKALARHRYTQDLNTGEMESHFLGSCSQHCPCRQGTVAANE